MNAIRLTEFSLDLFLWGPLIRIHLNLIFLNKPTEFRLSLFLRNRVNESYLVTVANTNLLPGQSRVA